MIHHVSMADSLDPQGFGVVKALALHVLGYALPSGLPTPNPACRLLHPGGAVWEGRTRLQVDTALRVAEEAEGVHGS
jgi:hypothetical protein